MTTRIEVPEYIRKWMLATFKKEDDNVLIFGENDDIYHIIADVLARRPENAPMIDRGNLEFRLPSPGTVKIQGIIIIYRPKAPVYH